MAPGRFQRLERACYEGARVVSSVIARFDPLAEWPEPDLRLANGGARPAPPFPIDVLGELGPDLAAIAASKGAPVDYLATALFTAAAGIIGAARYAQVRPGWVEPTALWGLNVGAPSSNKTPPLMVIQGAVAKIEAEAAPTFDADVARHQERVEVAKVEGEVWRERVRKAAKSDEPAPPKPSAAAAPEEPHRPRIFVANATPEAVSKLFSRNERGLLLIRDEAAAFFGDFGKYGGDGDAAFYLSTFSGVATPVDRVKEGGSTIAARGLLSIVGGIQPERLHELLMANRADDGLLSRFLMVWPDPAPIVFHVKPADEGLVFRLLQRLRALQMSINAEGGSEPQLIPLSDGATTIFSEWYMENTARARAGSGPLASFRGKGNGLVVRLALVLEHLSWAHLGGDAPTLISAKAINAALVLWEDYAIPMAERVYGDAALSPAERTAADLLKEIRRRRALSFNLRTARREWGVPGMSKPEAAEAAAVVLVDGDCIARALKSPGPGAPSSDYLVNPKLMERSR